MNNKLYRFIAIITNLLLFGLFFIHHYSGFINISIAGVSPIIPIALLVCVAMFSSELTASLTGLLLGFFMDSSSSGSSCLYTITLFIVGFSVSFIIHFFFNKNIQAAVALGAMSCSFVFICRWFFLHALAYGISESIGYLMFSALPCALYTTVFVIPFFFIERSLTKNINSF